MGTRADFYVGKGKEAEWLGSIAWDGNPDSIDAQVINCTSPEAFRHAVAEFLKRDDATLPKDGWPWPWEDSNTTDYAYVFDGEKCWASSFGSPWFDPTKEQPEDDEGEKPTFPNMKDRQNVQWGAKSGVLIFSAPK